MQLSALTTDEIIRIHSPQTELEKVLFERIETAIDEAECAKNDAAEIIRQEEDYQCGNCSALEDDKSDLEGTVKALRTRLDEHKIDHGDI